MQTIPIILTVWACVMILVLFLTNRTYSKEMHDSGSVFVKLGTLALVIASVLYLCADVFITIYNGGHNLR